MKKCLSCGNSYEDTEKYCPCCGNAAGADAMPNPVDAQQPIWVTQSLNQLHNGPLDESFLEVPVSEDFASRQNPPGNYLKSNSKYSDSVDTDIFDEIADSASTIYSSMSPKAKKIIISLIIGTLLSLIPFIYVACSYNAGPTAGSKSQVTISNILLPN